MPKSKIEENIISKIKNYEIKIKPKYYFVLGSLSIAIATISTFLLSTFLINVISNRVRMQKLFDYIGMNSYGRNMFLRNFPWHLVIITVALFGFGLYLFKKYDITYKFSSVVIAICLLVAVIGGGIAADRIGLNNHLRQRPRFAPMYQGALDNKDWVMGNVREKRNDFFMIRDRAEKEIRINFSNKTWMPPREFTIGECIRAVGELLSPNELNSEGIMRCPMNERKTLPGMY